MDHGNVEEDESFQLPPLVPPSPREDPDAVPEGVASDADHDPACVAEEPQPHINERAPSEDSDSSIDEETAIAASTKSPAMKPTGAHDARGPGGASRRLPILWAGAVASIGMLLIWVASLNNGDGAGGGSSSGAGSAHSVNRVKTSDGLGSDAMGCATGYLKRAKGIYRCAMLEVSHTDRCATLATPSTSTGGSVSGVTSSDAETPQRQSSQMGTTWLPVNQRCASLCDTRGPNCKGYSVTAMSSRPLQCWLYSRLPADDQLDFESRATVCVPQLRAHAALEAVGHAMAIG
jgi:hypothetical protein